MKLGFNDYFQAEYKHANVGHFRLYHDWLFDEVFKGEEVDPTLAKLIKMALFKASWTTMWTSSFVKIDYENEVVRRARIPTGVLKGEVISRLDDKRDYIPLLIPWTKSNNDIIAMAARRKIDSIELRTPK